MINHECVVCLWFFPIVLFFVIPLLFLPVYLIVKYKEKIFGKTIEGNTDEEKAFGERIAGNTVT